MCETWEEADGTFRTHLAQVSVAHGEGEWMQVGVEGKVGQGRGEGGGGLGKLRWRCQITSFPLLLLTALKLIKQLLIVNIANTLRFP